MSGLDTPLSWHTGFSASEIRGARSAVHLSTASIHSLNMINASCCEYRISYESIWDMNDRLTFGLSVGTRCPAPYTLRSYKTQHRICLIDEHEHERLTVSSPKVLNEPATCPSTNQSSVGAARNPSCPDHSI